MLDHINRRQAHNANLKSINATRNKSKYPLFKGWHIIIREKTELIVGNYKVKVLKKYLYCSKSSENK